MVYNIEFQIAGLIILILVATLYRKRRTVWIYTDRIFGMFISVALLSSVFDIASIFTINYRNTLPPLVNEFVCKSYLMSLILVAYMTLLYLFADILRSSNDYMKYNRYGIVIVVLVAAMFFVLPIDYYVDAEVRSIYTLGPAVLYTYAVCITFLVLSLLGILVFRSRVSNFRRNPVFVIIFSFIIAAIIQFINNQLLIVSFAVSISVLLIYLFMENPTDKVDEDTGFFNASMLNKYIDRQYVSNDRFFVIMIKVCSYDIYTRTFGITNTNALMVNFADYLKKIDDALLFRLGECRFVVAGSYKDENMYNRALECIESAKNKTFSITNTEIALDLEICIIKDSTLFNTSDEVMYYVNYLFGSMQNDEVLIIDQTCIDEVKRCNSIEETLRWAIENNKFEVYYQPIYSIVEQRFVAFEALIRLWDEQGNFIPPDEFIPIAEHNGMITEIDMIVLDKVCRFINDTDPLQYGIKSIEVNLSVVQCMQSSLAVELKKMLDYYGVPLEYIHFEITETAMANSRQSLLDNMNKLIGLGSAFFLDDYGSGYANLNFLIDLPFRAVKLDKELVWSYFTTAKGEIATKFAIDMLKHLGMEIVAEGVETKEQLIGMENFGVEYIQGYFFSKPLSEEEVIEFVRKAEINGIM